MNRAYRTDGTYNTCRSDKEAKAAVSRRRRAGRANRISAIPFFIGSFLLIAICCLVFNTFFVSAHGNQEEEPVAYTYYRSIQIEAGDTLWDIAEEYMTADCSSVEEYVEKLMELNNLSSDEIHAGEKLMIAYNDTEFVK